MNPRNETIEIPIPKTDNTSIGEPIDNLELGTFTILAGENNAGKTHLMKAIMSQFGKEKTIYIPAENIHAGVAVKITSAEDPMRKAIAQLLNIILDNEPRIEGNLGELFGNIENTFSSFGVPNTELKLKKKDFKKSDFEKILRDALAKTILDHTIIDRHGPEDQELKIENVGQGVQRIIIASIIQEVEKVNIGEEEVLILFEEPEIYLHPKLKEKLYHSLVSLSEEPSIKIVISTHDPYFIELGKDHEIYNVFRDTSSEAGSTKIRSIEPHDSYLDYKSYSEINYLIFDLVSDTYFLELFEKLLSFFKPIEFCEKCKRPSPTGYNLLNAWLKDSGATMITKTDPRITKLRQTIGHKNKDLSKYEVKKDDIKEVIKFIELKKGNNP